MKLTKKTLLQLLLILVSTQVGYATHIVGSTINYDYVGGNRYRITVVLYRDCRTTNPPIPVGAPGTIKVNVRRSDNTTFQLSIDQTSKTTLQLPLPIGEPCARPPDVPVCVEEYKYVREFNSFPAGFDYYLFFSLCCRNSTISNLAPEQQTETIYTKIPDRNNFTNLSNAQFTTQPPSYVCGGKPFVVTNDYTDADGDKVTYELYTPAAGSQNRIQSDNYYPAISGGFPVFTPVTYSTITDNGQSVTFSGQSPMNASEVIDADSGKLSFNAGIYGQFVVGIKMKEYRGTTLINETLRDYQFNIVRCPPPDKAVLALNDVCKSLRSSFANSGSYSNQTSFLWDFGDPSSGVNNTSTVATPSHTFSQAGNYTISLTLNPNTVCESKAQQQIKISALKVDFTSSGDTCVRMPISFTDKSTSSSNAAITNRLWIFGDGNTSSTTNPTHAYANGGNYNVRLIVTNSIGCKDSVINVIKVVQAYPDAVVGSNDTICKNNSTVQLNGQVSNAGGGLWAGGAGLFNPDRKTLSAKYTPTQTELDAGFVDLTLKTTNNGKCGSDSAKFKVVFTDPPKITAALTPYAPICANNLRLGLRGAVTPANVFGIKWTGGGGSFSPNDVNPFATYTPSATEISAGRVNLTITSTNNGGCLPVTANTSVNISPAPTINAGKDTTVCANSSDVGVRGSVTIATRILWRTNGGDGSFVGGNANLSTTYRLGPNDKTKGIVIVILETNEGVAATYPQNCNKVSDTMFIKITPAPIVKAGSDVSICSNNPKVTVKATVTPASGSGTGKWTGGNGQYSPDANALTMTYTPTAAEVTAKSVTLYMTSTNNDKCSAVTDTVKINYSPSPIVTVGPGGSVCKNNPTIKLSGTVSGASTTGVWSGGKGTYSPDSTSLSPTYTPTATEIASGSVKLTLKSTNNGTCLQQRQDVTFAFNDLPKIDAGSSVTACKNNPSAKLGASIIQGATSVRWSGGGGTFTPNDSTLTATYVATAAEANSGKVILTATSIGNGNCNAVTDTVSIRFINSPTVNPGTAGPVCANNNPIQLNGSTSTGKGVWSSTTGGTFSPNANALNATYIPSKQDSTAGLVTLRLTSDNNGLCASVFNTVTANITPAPRVNAGPQQIVCSNNPNIKLNGTVNGGSSTGIWSGGSNNFQGGNTNLAATYVPSAADLTSKKVTLMLTSTGNNGGKCVAATDTVTFYFTPAPILTVSSSIPVCGDNTAVPISATTNGVPTAFKWTSNGTGTFTNSTSLSTTYTPSTADRDANSVRLTLTTTAQGNCAPTDARTDIVFTTKPVVEAGSAQTFCTGDTLVQLAASGSAGKWTSTTGGTFVPSATLQNAQYRPSATDVANKTVTLTYTSDPIGPCTSATDNVKIAILMSPTVNPGVAQTVCSDQLVTLAASATDAIAVRWTSSGSGKFQPNDSTLNTSYKPSAAETSAGTTLLTLRAISSQCGSVSRNVLITLKPKYEVTTGGPQKFCSDVSQIQLSGTRSAKFPVKWTTVGATGTFSPNDTTLNAKFIPSTADKSSTGFSLTLSSNGTGCPNNSSTVRIDITAAPRVEAGSNGIICNDTNGVALKGTLLNANATGGFWTTTGGGTFSPNALTASYVPKNGEKGIFKFILTTTGNGICNAAKDSLTITIQDKPNINATSNKICADLDTIYLNSGVKNATGVLWTKLQANGTIVNPLDSTTSYLVTASDRVGGFASFKVKTTGVGVCKPVETTVVYDITPPITVYAGDTLNYCVNTPQIPLTATVAVANTIKWTTLGSGTFTNDAAFSTFYKPSSQDTANKKVSVVLTALGTSLCKSKSDTVTITFNPMPKVNVLNDFDVCADTSFIQLKATSTTGMGKWSSDGSSNFSPSVFDLNAKFAPSVQDIAKGKVKFTFTSTNNGSCAPVTKSFTVTITPSPTVSAGLDQEVCADASGVTLSPTPNAFGNVKWTTTGFGKFKSTNASSSTLVNDVYLLSPLDTSARQVTLTITTTNVGKCKPISDPVVIKITPAPYIDAGPSAQTICGDLTAISLTGKVGHAKGGRWTSDGSGKFAPTDSTAGASYLITSADSAKGNVKIKYTTYGVGKCKIYSDSLRLTITPAPRVAIGSNRVICADKDTIHLSGTKIAAKGVLWTSSGKGTFSPRPDSVNTVYVPTADDKINGVVIQMEATGIGSCKRVSDSLTVTITPAPLVDAGIGSDFCASVSSIDLDGSLDVATQGVWTTSGSGTFTDSSRLQTQYLPSASDKVLKTVTLTLTTVDNGLCNAVSSKVIYTFSPVPEVAVGSDQTICKDAGKVALNGSFKNAKGGFWEAVGVSQPNFQPDNSQSITSYVLSSADTVGTGMTFRYTTFGSGKCSPVSKTMNVKFLPVPSVNAGNDKTVCSDVQQIDLAGTVRNAGTGVWRASGSGVLSVGGQGLTATYMPTIADVTKGSVTFYLTSRNNNGCGAVTDSSVVTFIKSPQIVAIPSGSVCADTAGILISPTILDEGSLVWSSTSGTGTFLPSPTSKNVTFVPSSSQIANGKANLVLTVKGTGVCAASEIQSNTVIDISKAPSLSLSDISTCEGSVTVDLNAVRNNDIATQFQWTSLSPNPGTFSNSGQALAVTYTTSPQEQALVDGLIRIAFATTQQGKCKPYRDTINIRFVPTPDVLVGSNQIICTNMDSVRLNASGSAGVWSRVGAGTGGVFSPSNNALNASYFPSADDKAAQVAKLVFTSTPGGTCTPKSDTLFVNIKEGPTARPVPTTDTVICANSGPVAVMANNSLGSKVTWMTDGTGVFGDTLASTTTYNPSASDILSGQILIRLKIVDDDRICTPTYAKFNLNITPAPQVYAGNNLEICGNATSIQLGGQVTKASIGKGEWTRVAPAAGLFASTNAASSKKLDDFYQPNSADITAKTVKLLLTSDDNGKCNPVADTVVIHFTPAPLVSVGGPSVVCGDTTFVPLAGSVTVVGGGQWTHNGEGFFTDTNQVITRYIPSEDERSNGAVINFTLNSNPAGTCLSEKASFDLTINPLPTLNIGNSVVACGDTAYIGLNGQVSNVGSGRWSVAIGTGKFQSNQKDTTSFLTDKYVPSKADIATGQILLKLITTNTGQCKAISDFKSIQLTPTPKISAGLDYEVCGNNRLVNLEGQLIRVATGGKWSTSSTGQFTSKQDSLVSTFAPSSADSANKSVSFILTSTGNGACKPVKDTMVVRINPAPFVNPGAAIDTCADFNSVALNGTVQRALGGFWTTDGTGTFTDPTSLITEYEPTEADKTKGIVLLTLTSDGNSNCLAVKKQVQLTITPRPLIFAGNDTTICSDAVSISLLGTKNSAVQAVKWSSNGNSSFTLPVAQLATQYKVDSIDTNAGAVAFIFESTQQGKCKPIQDVKIVSFQQAPKVFVSAGFPRTVCESNSAITLDGVAQNANRTVWSTVSKPNFIESEFDDSMSVKTDYQPVLNAVLTDTSYITLRLSGYSTIGKCTNGASRDVVITILPEPKIDLGPEDTITVCADKDTVHLSSIIKIANTSVPGFWTTTGTGVFEKNGFINNPVYRLSTDDRTKQQISFVYKSDGFAGCDTVFKTKVLKLIPSVPTSDAGPDQTICANNPVVSLKGEITVATNFVWSNFPNGGSFNPANELSTTFLATQPIVNTGAAKIKLTTKGPGKCKDVIDEMLVSFSNAPVINIKADSVEMCDDSDSLQLAADIKHAGGGLWTSSGSGQFLPSATELNAIYQPSTADKMSGSVQLKLTSTDIANCLPVSDSLMVKIRKAPLSVAATTNNANCVSQTGIALQGSSTTGFGVWSTTGTGSFSPNANEPAATYYPGFDDYAAGKVSLVFTTKDNKTCKPVSESVVVNVNTLPIADAGKDQKICIGTATVINPITQPNLVTYTWSRLLPSAATIDSMVFSTGELTTRATYELRVVDTKGCDNVDTMEVNVFNRPLLDYSSPYCAYDLIKPATLPLDTIDGVFQWYRDGGILSAQNRSSIQPDRRGTYKNVFSVFNCSISDSTLVRPVPVLNGVNKILCQNISNDTIAMNFVPDNKGYTWSYSKFNSNVKNTLSDKDNSVVFNIATDTLVFYATVVDSTNICSATDSVIVFPVAQPSFSKLKDTVMCAGNSIVLDATPTNYSSTRIQYLWQPGNVTNAQYPVSIPSSLTKADTSLYIIRFDLGECSVKDTAKVIGNPLPIANLPTVQFFCSELKDSKEPNPIYLDAGSNGKILWNTGDTSRVISTLKEGFYKVTVTNKFKCTNSDSTTLIEKCEPMVYFPDAFSPNGDNRNDVFRVFGNKFVKNFKVMIFSRWGEVIFYMEDIPGESVFEVSNKAYTWDGTYRGEQMPIGVYEYIATYEGKTEEFKGPYKKVGSVMIVR